VAARNLCFADRSHRRHDDRAPARFGPRLTTGPGEWQTKVLSDGSTLRLGPSTAILIEFTGTHRHIRLEQGEALFRVRPDSKRPFLVETELAIARAVGTAFAVSCEGQEQLVRRRSSSFHRLGRARTVSCAREACPCDEPPT